MEGMIVRIGTCVIHRRDCVIIKDNTFKKLGNASWALLNQLITHYPDHTPISDLEDVLSTGSPRASDVGKKIVGCVAEIRKLLGEGSILNHYSLSYSFNNDLPVSDVSLDEYSALIYDCKENVAKGLDLKNTRSIEIKNPDGSSEPIHLLKSFEIVDLKKQIVVLSKGERDNHTGKYNRVYVSEIVEKTNGEFEMVGIDDPGLFAAVRLALIEIAHDDKATDLSVSSLKLVEQIIDRRSVIEKLFLKYPYARKYFFEEKDSMPENEIDYQQVISIANMFAQLFYEIESSAYKLPTFFMNYLFKFERNIYQSEAIKHANELSPENWQYLDNIPL